MADPAGRRSLRWPVAISGALLLIAGLLALSARGGDFLKAGLDEAGEAEQPANSTAGEGGAGAVADGGGEGDGEACEWPKLPEKVLASILNLISVD